MTQYSYPFSYDNGYIGDVSKDILISFAWRVTKTTILQINILNIVAYIFLMNLLSFLSGK